MTSTGGGSRERRRVRRDMLGLRPLADVPDVEVAAGQIDVRGWIVVSGDGVVIGTVRDLLADLDSLRVRQLMVEIGPEGTPPGDGRVVLIAIDQVEADPDRDLVIVGELRAKDVDSLVEYRRELLESDDEAGMLRRIGVHALMDFEAEGGASKLEIPPPLPPAGSERDRDR